MFLHYRLLNTKLYNKPTHTNGNILDFLLTNNPDTIFGYKTTHTIHYFHDFYQNKEN